MKQPYGCVKHFPHAAVHICTDITEYSEMVHESQKWLHSIYGCIEEELPSLGKIIQTSSLFNVNLYHDLVIGHTMTGILHLVNQTPIEWKCEKQATVAAAICSSEFINVQSTTAHIIDLKYHYI